MIDHIPADAFADAVGPVPPVLAAMVNGVLLNVLVFGFAYFFGETAWVAARREHELRAQAEDLRRSQAEARERAVLGERVRIARELHDVVAHHVSVMGVQASACRRVFDRDPGKARTALTAIEQSARTAVDELRRMLGVLRDLRRHRRRAADGRRRRTDRRAGRAGSGRRADGHPRGVRRPGRVARIGLADRLPGDAGGGDQHAEARRGGACSTCGSGTWPGRWRST